MSEAATKEIAAAPLPRKGDTWLVALYLVVTFLVNLGALLAVPKLTTSEIAKQTLPFYALPVLWAGYLLCKYRTSWLRRAGYIAALPGLVWLLALINDLRLIIRG